MNDNLWIIGCGDIGRRVINNYIKQQKTPPANIYTLVSSDTSKYRCEQLGVNAVALDLDDKDKLDTSGLDKTIKDSRLFYFAPPSPIGREDTRLKNFLSSLSAPPKRMVLISTTGVYGDSKGQWIDETSAIKPQADRAYRRLSTEKVLKEWAQTHHTETIILRVPAIYAKGRLPLARLKKGLPIINQAEAGWTNRIHADDLAMVCQQAMESTITDEIYNVTDGHPSTMTEYFNQVADYANLPYPPQITLQQAEATLSAGILSYLKESRRISNQKMRDELGVRLRYPSLKEGLQSLPR